MPAPVRGQAPVVDRQTAAHLLEQSTFGPTEADVSLVMSQGYEQWLNNQLAMTDASPIPADPESDLDDLRNQLLLNMANGPDQLRQRVMFALSQIVVVSANKNGPFGEMAPWVDLLSRHAFGSYRHFLREVVLSAPMGNYLDNWLNRCTRDETTCPHGSSRSTPNENFARELLQLFSLGLWELNINGTVRLDEAGRPIPTYSQQTLVEYARALTGWTFARTGGDRDFSLEMVPDMRTVCRRDECTDVPEHHYTGPKFLLGGVVAPASANTTQAMYNDVGYVVDSIMRHPNLAPFVSSRLIRSLVTSNPSPNYIQRVATAFAASDGDMRTTLRAILLDPEARSFTITDGRLKDPVLHMVGLVRALGVTLADPGDLQWPLTSLQQRLLTPSTVFSFYSLLGPLPGNLALLGPEFGIYPPALAVQRANLVYRILDNGYESSIPMEAALAPFEAAAGNAAALVELVNQRLMFGRMSPELRELILAATNAITDTDADDLRQRAIGALYLAAISSEYSVYSDTSVSGASTVQPPTGLAASSLSGSTVSIGWRAPLIGPPPTGYILEGGVRPGEVLATIPIAGATTEFTFQAPPGAYYIRLRTVSGAAVSRPSSEVRLYIGATSGPTAPRALTAYGNGSSVVLDWRNTFGGGEPMGVAIDVAQDGARVASIPMPVTDHWSYDAVPPGRFSFTVRATNASGTSGSSNSVTLTFPLSGCGNPRSPQDFSVAVNGRYVSASWQVPDSGTAPTYFTVYAEMRVRRDNRNQWVPVGTFPVTGTAIGSPVAPGRYRVRVRSENICNRDNTTSSFTSWREARVEE